jgi:hypothetical protein
VGPPAGGDGNDIPPQSGKRKRTAGNPPQPVARTRHSRRSQGQQADVVEHRTAEHADLRNVWTLDSNANARLHPRRRLYHRADVAAQGGHVFAWITAPKAATPWLVKIGKVQESAVYSIYQSKVYFDKRAATKPNNQ